MPSPARYRQTLYTRSLVDKQCAQIVIQILDCVCKSFLKAGLGQLQYVDHPNIEQTRRRKEVQHT